MIDYRWRTEATEADFQKVVRHDAMKFLGWRAKAASRKALPLEQSFRSWWLQCGRTGFRTPEDSLLFRDELLRYAIQLKTELSE